MKLIVYFASILLFFGCNNSKQNSEEPIIIDFSKQGSENGQLSNKDSVHKLKVVVSAIITPHETFIYYSDLFD